MTPDWLEQATRAAREVGHASPVESAQTRRRVLRALPSGSARRPVRTIWAGLAAAALLGGSAWAAGATHVGLSAWLGTAQPTEDVTRKESTTPVRASARADVNPPAVREVVAPALLEPPAEPAIKQEPKPGETSPTAPAVRAVDALSLYKDAHALHFRSHDYARALDAWSRYLAAAPADAREGLVPEARYNHAICLLRVGRRSEARAELRPFAEGAWGGYRQEDARALLGGIDAR